MERWDGKNAPEHPRVVQSESLRLFPLDVPLAVTSAEDDTLGAGKKTHTRPRTGFLSCQGERDFAPLVLVQVERPRVAQIVGCQTQGVEDAVSTGNSEGSVEADGSERKKGEGRTPDSKVVEPSKKDDPVLPEGHPAATSRTRLDFGLDPLPLVLVSKAASRQ